MRQYDESQVSSSGSITDLKRELARVRDVESASSLYIAELESRLAKADESVLALRAKVEELEHECERRREQVEDARRYPTTRSRTPSEPHAQETGFH